jgi:hypothetical protein
MKTTISSPLILLLLLILILLLGAPKGAESAGLDEDRKMSFPNAHSLLRRSSYDSRQSRRHLSETLQAFESSADLIAANIAGSGITIWSVSFEGLPMQIGLFSGGADTVGLSSGAVLSTGSVEEMEGPNDGQFTSSKFDQPGYGPLTKLTGNSTHDAVVLTVMFKCNQPGRVSIRYVLGSEDYSPSNTGYAWEDVIGIFLNGLNPKNNIATVQGSYVSVKTINCSPGNELCPYYVNNTGQNTEMNGFTTVLEATGTVYSGINVMTIAIADGFDSNYPSWLLLGQGSMKCKPASGAVSSPGGQGGGASSGTASSVTPSAACFTKLTGKCPCGNAMKLRRCVRRQIESKCSPPSGGEARTSYFRGLQSRFAKAAC